MRKDPFTRSGISVLGRAIVLTRPRLILWVASGLVLSSDTLGRRVGNDLGQQRTNWRQLPPCIMAHDTWRPAIRGGRWRARADSPTRGRCMFLTVSPRLTGLGWWTMWI